MSRSSGSGHALLLHAVQLGVRPQRSSDSVNTSLARANVAVVARDLLDHLDQQPLDRLGIAGGTDENAAVRFTSAIGLHEHHQSCDRLGVVLAHLHAADAPVGVELEDDQLAVAGVARRSSPCGRCARRRAAAG
jgi:hypothetical protein